MAALPDSEIYLLVRTWFGDDAGWDELCAVATEETDEGFLATVQIVDDPAFDGFTPEQLKASHPHRVDGWDVLYIADELAITHPGHPILLIRVGSVTDLPFRCRADLLYEVDANLSLANLDWDDFRDQVDADGVYGGMGDPSQDGEDAPPALAPEVAAHAAGSAAPVTIAVPAAVWSAMLMDLENAQHAVGETNHKRIRAIAYDIYESIEHGTVAPRVEPDADVIVSFPARDWAFILERARRLGPHYGLYLGGGSFAPPSTVIELLSHHLER
jgi:hypothetical protein